MGSVDDLDMVVEVVVEVFVVGESLLLFLFFFFFFFFFFLAPTFR